MNINNYNTFVSYNSLYKELLKKGGELLKQIHDNFSQRPEFVTIIQLTDYALKFETVGQVFTIRIKMIPEDLVKNRNAILQTYYQDPTNDNKEQELPDVHTTFDKLGNIGVWDVDDFCKYYSYNLPDAWHKLNLPVVSK